VRTKVTRTVSDLSGEEVTDGEARVRVIFLGPPRRIFELDVTTEEANELAAKGREVRRRGSKKANE